jgi:hypothetical protein
LKEAWGADPAPPAAHPVRDWIAEHPWTTAAMVTGTVLGAALVWASIVAVEIGSMH